MKRNKHRSFTVSHSAVSAAAIGVGIAVVLTTALCAVLTSLVLNASVQEKQTGLCVFVIRALSVLIGCLVGCAIGKEKQLQTIGTITGCYLVVLLGLGIVIYDESFQSFGIGITSTLMGGVGAFLIQMRPQKNRKHTAKYNR